MGQYDYSYSIPDDFERRVRQILRQLFRNSGLAEAFESCSYEYEELGNAYYAGLRGDNWNMKALDFTVEGPEGCIEIIEKYKDALKDAISKGLKPRVSGFQVREIILLAVDDLGELPSTNEARLKSDIEAARSVLADLVAIGERLCLNSTYSYERSEDSMNDFLRDALSLMGYTEVKDQTRHGLSSKGENAGEVDILVSKSRKEVALVEGFKLNSVHSSYIDSHIDKTIRNYNALGTATFIVAYVSVSDFEGFWDRYMAHLRGYDFGLEVKKTLSVEADPNAATRIASTILCRDGYDFPVYFLALKLSR